MVSPGPAVIAGSALASLHCTSLLFPFYACCPWEPHPSRHPPLLLSRISPSILPVWSSRWLLQRSVRQLYPSQTPQTHWEQPPFLPSPPFLLGTLWLLVMSLCPSPSVQVFFTSFSLVPLMNWFLNLVIVFLKHFSPSSPPIH